MTRTLCQITNTKLKKKNSLIFHIRYTINGVEKYTQYKANKLHQSSISLECNISGCRARLTLKFGGILETLKTGANKYEWASHLTDEDKTNSSNYGQLGHKHTRCCTLFEGDSCSVSLHRKPECTNEISPIVKRDFYEEIRAFFKKNPSCSNTTAINYVKVLINLI